MHQLTFNDHVGELIAEHLTLLYQGHYDAHLPQVELLSIAQDDEDLYHALLKVETEQRNFTVSVDFWIDNRHLLMENRIHIERREELP